MESTSAGPFYVQIPIGPIATSGPLTPEFVNSSFPTSRDDRPTIFTDGRTPVNISSKHLKAHPLHIPTGTAEVLTFYPTHDEFRDFNRYIRIVEQKMAHLRCGIAKIVPPEGWTPRPTMRDFSDTDDYIINSPSRETIMPTTTPGVYQKKNQVCKLKMTVREFRASALSPKYANPRPHLSGRQLEEHYFQHITEGEPIYGADTEGTFYEKGIEEFNMNGLGTVLDESGTTIKGVNTVYLYFGMYKTTFPWHAEDMDLYSINYLHFGAPKYWFAISSEHADRFERLMQQSFFLDQYGNERPLCNGFLRHKTSIVTTDVLRAANIPYGTMIQNPNEFIITFPRGYHMGFNLGYNLAESTNFATDRWIDYGKDAVLCECSSSVVIPMRDYVKNHRNNELMAWQYYWFGGGRPRWLKPKNTYVPKKRRLELEAEAAAKKAKVEAAFNSDDSTPKEDESVHFMKLKGYKVPEYEVRSDYDELMKYYRDHVSKTIGSKNPIDFFEEKKHNKEKSAEWPHCSVCQHFQPSHITATVDLDKCENAQSICAKLKKSPRLVPLWCFAKENVKEERNPEERLLTCDNCYVTVHPSCCSGDDPANFDNGQKWKCPRCLEQTDEVVHQISCQLCELRGGALIPCRIGTDLTWAHVICALFNRRSTFNRPIGPTSCSVEPLKRQFCEEFKLEPPLTKEYRDTLTRGCDDARWECFVCHRIQEGLAFCILCMEENPSPDVMPTMAHITCARTVGFCCEVREYPIGAAMICHSHEHTPSMSSKSSTYLKKGDIVYVEDDSNNDKKHVPGKIDGYEKKDCAVVDFIDNTRSKDNRLEDILSCECLYCEKGEHQYGARVKVVWDDKKVYDGYYRGKGEMPEYKIELENGTIVNHPRSRIKNKKEYNAFLKQKR